MTNAGGPGVLAADALMEGGGELAQLSPETMAALDAILPPHWSHGNPIDILADATEATYERAVELAMKDIGADGVLAITAPLVAAQPKTMATSIAKYAALGKPLIASLFNYMWKFGENLKTLESAEKLVLSPYAESRTSPIIEQVGKEGRTILTEVESKQLFEAYGIPVTQTLAAANAEEAVQAARTVGFPVVLKLLSKTITHKSDVGGVKLNIETEAELRTAYYEIRDSILAHHSASDFSGVSVQPMVRKAGYELILGSSIDAQFGPIILFGAGGVFAEVMKDSVLELPPISPVLARRMIEQTKIWQALKGTRGKKPIDISALESLLVKFSQLVIDQPWIAEIDINPLVASPEGCIALDARVVLHDPATQFENLPRPAMMSMLTQDLPTEVVAAVG